MLKTILVLRRDGILTVVIKKGRKKRPSIEEKKIVF